MSRNFQILPHTSDLRLFVSANSLPDLFLTALAGLNEILKPGFCEAGSDSGISCVPGPANGENKENNIYKKNNIIIKVSAPDETALLVDYLSEVLTRSSLDRRIYGSCIIHTLTGTLIEAELTGMPVEDFDHDIKAVTYHEADVRLENGVYSTILVFDI